MSNASTRYPSTSSPQPRNEACGSGGETFSMNHGSSNRLAPSFTERLQLYALDVKVERAEDVLTNYSKTGTVNCSRRHRHIWPPSIPSLTAAVHQGRSAGESLGKGVYSGRNFKWFERDTLSELLSRSKGDEDIGLRARVRVQKSKVSRPYKQAEFEIMLGEGVSKLGCVLDCAEIMEVVVKKGSWYSYEDQRLGQGREKALQHLRENPFLQEEIEKKVRLLMLDGEVHRSTPLFSSSSSSASHREEEDSLDDFQ